VDTFEGTLVELANDSPHSNRSIKELGLNILISRHTVQKKSSESAAHLLKRVARAECKMAAKDEIRKSKVAII